MFGDNPRTKLRTHTVTNVPGYPRDANLYTDDQLLREHVIAAGGVDHELHLSQFGAKVGSNDTLHLGQTANRNPPTFHPYDSFGRRIDEVAFHPSYHQLMDMGLSHGVSARAWTQPQGGHVAHCALLFMMSQADGGVTCPMSMTYAAIPTLRHEADVARIWEPLLLSARYDQRVLPVEQKYGATLGMAMTEKQGGSDVRANTTQAVKISANEFRLVGHKWFCSAPMSDGFLTLAKYNDQLGCYLVPRWQPDGTRNSVEIQRLKDKLGDQSNASSEIEYHDAFAIPIGESGRGVRTIIEMVNHTRVDCAVAATSLMRQSLSWAIFHTQHRRVFGSALVKQPLMRRVLADMALEVEGHMALVFFLAEMLDQSTTDQQAAILCRSLTPIVKFWSTKRCPVLVVEAMECIGGAGYIEEHILPRIYRQAPLNGIWEGSGNVIALDFLRALAKNPTHAKAISALLIHFQSKNMLLGGIVDSMLTILKNEIGEIGSARYVVEQLAKCLTACVLYHRGYDDIAESYVRTRLPQQHMSFGAHTQTIDEEFLLDRAAVFTA